VVGGCFKAIAQHPAIVDAHRVVYIDAYSETDDVASTPDLVPIDLARDETVRSLCARFDRRSNDRPHLNGVQAHLDRVIAIMGCKSVDLAKGLGQVPAVAYLAWQARLEQGLAGTFRAMIDDLTVRAGGQLARVEIDVFHSNAGATGRGIANAVVETICNLFQGRTVSVTHYVVGRMSFTGLGAHVHDNAPLGVLEDMAFQRHPPTQAKTVHRWLGIELPPVANDVQQRSAYAALWAQAITAPRTRELLDRPQANRSAADDWGNFTLVRSGWYRSAMEERDVVVGAAHHALHETDRVLAEGAAEAPLSVVYDVPLAPAEDLVQGFPADLQKGCHEALEGVSNADSLTALVKEGAARLQPMVRFRRASGEEASAGALFHAPAAADYAALVADLREARAIRAAVAAALAEEQRARAEQGELERALRRCERNLQRAVSLLCPRGIDEHLRALWHPPARRRLTFLHAAVAYRRLAAHKAEHEVRRDLLRRLLERADEQIRLAQEPFHVIRRALERLIDRQPPADERAVRFRGLDERLFSRQTVFEALLRAARADNHERLYHELRQTARGVTLHGLAAILKLGPDADALAVVNKLDSDGAEMGPYWGGQPRPDAEIDQRIRVLPPLEADLYRALLQAKDEIGSSAQFVCAESMAGGIGIVCLDTYLVKQWYDLLPPEYQQDLVLTLSSGDATALAHVPGHALYVDGLFEAMHYIPGDAVRELLGLPQPAMPLAEARLAASPLEES